MRSRTIWAYEKGNVLEFSNLRIAADHFKCDYATLRNTAGRAKSDDRSHFTHDGQVFYLVNPASKQPEKSAGEKRKSGALLPGVQTHGIGGRRYW